MPKFMWESESEKKQWKEKKQIRKTEIMSVENQSEWQAQQISNKYVGLKQLI